MKFRVNPKIFQKFPGVRIGVLVLLGIENSKRTKEINQLLTDEQEKREKELTGKDLKDLVHVSAWREIYRQFGSKPRKYRSSVEALLRRVQSESRLPSINPLVDLYNYLSIRHFLPVGAEDLDKVKGDIELTFAQGNETGTYIGAREAETCYRGEVVYKDDLGFICRRWNWREGERTKIDRETENAALVLEAVPSVSDGDFKEALNDAEKLVKKFLGGKVIAKILTPEDPVLEVDFETGKKARREEAVVKEIKVEPGAKKEKEARPFKGITDDLVDKSGTAYKLQKAVWKAVGELDKGLKIENVHLEHPTVADHGDYATNIALQLAKTKEESHWRSRMELAKGIAKRAQGEVKDCAKVTVIKPGFINFTLSQEVLIKELQKILREKNNFGKSDWGKGKTVVIDYSSPNIARPFGIGHLRSTIIGQALYNIYQFSGWRCIGDNHLGDWGTQFGKLIFIIRREGLDAKKLTVGELEKLYVRFHKEAKDNPQLEEEGRKWFKKLEDGDKEAREIWQACVDLSLEEFGRIYNLLGIKIDYALGESFYEDKMAEVIQEAEAKGVARKSEGAWIIEIPGIGPPLMLLKSDGATTYHARDLATIKYRIKTWNPSLCIYEVGADHILHFRQLFAAAEKLGYGKRGQLVHVAHGMIRSAEGRFSTRKGTIVHLDEVLNEAVARAERVSEKAGISKELSRNDREGVARAVGIGGIKYNDLKQNPGRDIVFDWGKVLSLEGDSGPYLQYTHARCCSVLAKAGSWPGVKPDSSGINPDELALLRTLYKFPEIIQEAGRNFAPNLICNFLFDLAQKFNLFYHRHSILTPEAKDGKEKKRDFRLCLTAATAQVLRNGLILLGIEPLERM